MLKSTNDDFGQSYFETLRDYGVGKNTTVDEKIN